MTHALLYRPGQKRSVATAFGSAVLIHFTAVALAAIQPHQSIDYPSSDEGPVVTFDSFEGDSTPPPDVEPPSPAVVNQTDDLFPEPQSTPVPVRKQTSTTAVRLHREALKGSTLTSISNTRALAVIAPRPEYPYEARRQRVTGSGTFAITVNPMTGNVTNVLISQSTGSPYLDNAALAAFRRWRFKPGSAPNVTVPITFTLMGSSY